MRNEQRDDTVIFGKNAVAEALKGAHIVDTVYVDNTQDKAAGWLRALAREQGSVVKEVGREKLDFMTGHGAHQGVAARIVEKPFVSVGDMLDKARDAGHPPLLLMLDKVEDPHNFGAILRTADCAGTDGVITAKRHSAPLSGAAWKASAGSAAHVDVARVGNLVSAIKEVKERGVFVYGADMDGPPMYDVDLTGPLMIVVGAEGEGLSRLVRETCDGLVGIPMHGRVNSLNVSVAAAVVLFEALRQREGGETRA